MTNQYKITLPDGGILSGGGGVRFADGKALLVMASFRVERPSPMADALLGTGEAVHVPFKTIDEILEEQKSFKNRGH